MKMKPSLERFLEISPSRWDDWAKRHSTEEMQTIAREADSIAQQCVLISQYLCYRGACGFGDHGHIDALREAQKDLKRVRKAMGFTHP